MKNVVNIEAVLHSAYITERWAASWDVVGEGRYHVWFDAKTRQIETDWRGPGRGKLPILYKNPPAGVKPGHPGYFPTRKLDASSPGNEATIKLVFEVIDRDGLIEKARIAYREREEKRHKEQREAAREYREREAGPKMAAILRRLAKVADGELNHDTLKEFRSVVEEGRQIIAKIEESI